MFRVQCVVGSSPQRSGSLHRLALIGSDTANSILENSCLKTQPFFFLVVFRRYPDRKHPGFKDTLSHSLFPTTTSPHPPASVSARFGVLRFCPTARKLTRGSMVLNFHCNKWITGGDPTKVSGGFFLLLLLRLRREKRLFFFSSVGFTCLKMALIVCSEDLWSHEAKVGFFFFYVVLTRHFSSQAQRR